MHLWVEIAYPCEFRCLYGFMVFYRIVKAHNHSRFQSQVLVFGNDTKNNSPHPVDAAKLSIPQEFEFVQQIHFAAHVFKNLIHINGIDIKTGRFVIGISKPNNFFHQNGLE